jgi:hypothetical protein
MFLILLATSQPAFAWKHTTNLWNRDYLPLKWYISDYDASNSAPCTTCDSNDENPYYLQAIIDSYDNWVEDVPCAQLTHRFEGVRENHHSTGRDSTDAKNTFYYDDPSDEQGSGILGVTYTVNSGMVAFNRDGQTYRYSYDSDIVFSKDVPWVASPDMELSCNGTALESVATHEIGHQLGMGHSCEEEEVTAGLCEDQELRDANMFWTAPSCNSFASKYDAGEIFSSDDVEGMTALYGPYATFEASTATYGGVPLEVCFSLSSTSAIRNVEWLFGDGTEEDVTVENPEDYEICHTYEDKGQFTINVTIFGESEDCGEWKYTDRERAMVVACEPPQAAVGFDGIFTYEHVEDYTYQMINQADTTVYGCIDRISWDIFKGDTKLRSVSAWSPKIDLSGEVEEHGEGDYKIVLNLGGPGGLSAETISIAATEEATAKGGCAVVTTSGGLFAGLLAFLGISIRRRES